MLRGGHFLCRYVSISRPVDAEWSNGPELGGYDAAWVRQIDLVMDAVQLQTLWTLSFGEEFHRSRRRALSS
jgi:hypothetical protein